MPETMRLNKPYVCNGCGLVVNPFVLKRTYPTVKVECPTCGYEEVVDDLDLLRDSHQG